MKKIPDIRHSQGPWRILNKPYPQAETAIWVGNEYSLAEVRHGADVVKNGGIDGQIANAQLIALAPAMYNALKKIHDLVIAYQEDGSTACMVREITVDAFDQLNEFDISWNQANGDVVIVVAERG